MTYPIKLSNNRWIIEVKENEKTKELYIEFPDDALSQVGWDIGDTLNWTDMGDGSWSLSKVDKETQ
jgi:hypothetical protein